MCNLLELILSLPASRRAAHSVRRRVRNVLIATIFNEGCLNLFEKKKRSLQHLKFICYLDNTAIPERKENSLPLQIEERLLNHHLTSGNYLPIKTKKENWRWVKITKGKRVLLSR